MAKWGLSLILMALFLSQLDDHHHQAAATEAIYCEPVETKLVPCMPFLKGSASSVPTACCQAAQSLNNYVINEPDPERRGRGAVQSVCECLKQAAKSNGVDVSRAKQIPQLCNIKVPIFVDPNACTKA